MQALINTSYLPEISWTGRGKKKERKVAFSRFTHLIDFIKVMTLKADNEYSDDQVDYRLTYHIFKRAPSKFGATGKKSKDRNVNQCC